LSDLQQELPNPLGHETSPQERVPIDPDSLARHYEQHDVDVRSLVRFGVSIVVGGVVAGIVLWMVVRSWTNQPLPAQMQIPPAEVTAPVAPGPGLDAAPEVHLENMLQRENERLNSYGWIDRERGIVHIPIEEAMRLLVEKGIPAQEGVVPDFRLDPSLRMDSTGGVMPVGVEATSE
jgi:hypothetical protein